MSSSLEILRRGLSAGWTILHVIGSGSVKTPRYGLPAGITGQVLSDEERQIEVVSPNVVLRNSRRQNPLGAVIRGVFAEMSNKLRYLRDS